MKPTKKTAKTTAALNKRNKAAAKVRQLEDALYSARKALADAEDSVYQAQRAEGTTISWGGAGMDWNLA